MKGTVKIILGVGCIVVLFITPWSPIKAFKNMQSFIDIKSNISSYKEIAGQSKDIKLNFESKRTVGTPALFEPSTAVEKITAIEGVSVQEISVLQNAGSTVKNVGTFSPTFAKDDIDALQFIVNVKDVGTFMKSLDALQYLVESIKVSPSEKTIVFNINFIGGLKE